MKNVDLPFLHEFNYDLISDFPSSEFNDPFKIRQWININYPELSSQDKLWLSQSLSLSKRLKEKRFPFSFWWITQNLFEMATDFRIANFHAQLLKGMSLEVTDLTAGSGFDLSAFLIAGLKVSGYETDPGSFSLLERNLNYYFKDHFQIFKQSLFGNPGKVPEFWFADPMRRSGSGRTFRLDDYSPPFSEIVSMKGKSAGCLVKISPMTNLSDPALNGFKKVIVSLEGECREILLIHGNTEIADGSMWIDGKFFNPENEINQVHPSAEEGKRFIYDPDPAVMKSGHLSFWADKVGLSLPASDSGFPQGFSGSVEPLFNPFLLIDDHSYKIKDIPELARKYSPRRVILKKKNSSVKLEEIEKLLGNKTGKTDPPVYLFITGENEKTVVYVAER